MNVEDLNFPVVCFSQHLVIAKETVQALTICSKTALRPNGFFDGMTIVDSTGNALKIKGARKLHGIGLFAGYNIFLNQRIKISLMVDGPPVKMSLSEVRDRVFESFKHRHGWSSRGDLEKLKENVNKAETISDLIKLFMN